MIPVALIPLLLILVFIVAAVIRRRQGYGVGRNVIVRCRAGHLFTTIWIPGASLKAIRFGSYRIQRCPVGHHFTVVRAVRASQLSDEERQTAARFRDLRIP